MPVLHVNPANCVVNPFRDMAVDPLDQDRIETLKLSIHEDDCWGGAVGRVRVTHDDPERPNCVFEVAAGMHRIRAAQQLELTVVPLYVGDLDDEAMVRIYYRENETQRGMSATALIGSVASALRMAIKSAMTPPPTPQNDKIRNQLGHKAGLGAKNIMHILDPKIASQDAIDEQVRTLKASGDYARIIDDVKREMTKDGTEEYWGPAIPQQPQATFDLHGVARWFNRDAQITAYRDIVTRDGVATTLPMASQAAFAKEIAEKAQEEKRELSVAFINERAIPMILASKKLQRSIDDEARARLHAEDYRIRFRHYMSGFMRHVGGTTRAGKDIELLLREHPEANTAVSPEFVTSMRTAHDIIGRLASRFIRTEPTDYEIVTGPSALQIEDGRAKRSNRR